MKKLKYLLFLFIIFLVPSVFADTSYNMTGLITSPVNFPECGVGSYTGVELNGATNCWNTNTRYQGTLNRIYFNLPAPTGTTFDTDTAYRLTLNMATDDWRNNFGTVVVSPGSSYTNNFVDTFTFVSMKQINITFTVPYSGSTSYQYLWVNLPAKSSGHLITGTSNWNLSNITLTKLTSGSGGGSTDPGGPSTSFDDTAIINSGKENTQDIINNNNTNTQDIINNNNQNTQDIIDNQNNSNFTCANSRTVTFTSMISGSYIGNDDTIYSNPNFFVSNYVYVKENSNYIINFNDITGMEYGNMCWYHNNDLISCSQYREMSGYSASNFIVTSPSNSNKLKLTVRNNSNATITGYICTNNQQENINAINDSTNTIINNQNQNAQQTQDVINNNLNNCVSSRSYRDSDITLDNYRISNASGTTSSSSSYGIVQYIPVNENTDYTLSGLYGASYFCLYNSSKSLISCTSYNSRPSVSFNSGNAAFISISLYKGRVFNLSGNYCSNRLDDVTNSITNSNVENGTGSDFFDDFTSQDFGLSQIITIPLNTIQSLTSSSCVPLQIPIPFTNSNVTLPCMTEIYQNRFSTIYNLWKIVSFGIVAYLIAIDIFHIVKGFKDPESDKVEVLDL